MAPRKRTPRPDRHKYPTNARNTRSYHLDKVPNDILDAAIERARSSKPQTSLRVVLIDFLDGYGDGRLDPDA
jgi:hypothetical protein